MAESEVNTPKTFKRIYFVSFSVVFAVLLLVCVISLGTFGRKQAEVNSETRKEMGRGRCILFGKYERTEKKDDKDTVYILLSPLGTCVFVLWGQVSLSIVVFVWLGYSIIAAILGFKV